MTRQEAQTRAERLGLSTWVVEAIGVGPKSKTVPVRCVGFASVGVAIAEGETWEEALEKTMKVIFAH